MYISGNSVLSEKVVIVAPQSISEVSPEYVVGAVITIDASAETSKKGKEPLIGLAIASPPPNTGWYGLDLPGKATARVVKSRPPSPQPLHIPYTPLPTPPTTLGTPPARSAPLATPPQPPALPAPPAPPATPAPPSAPANHAPVPPTAPPLPTPQTTMAMVLDAVGQNTTASTVARTVMERLGLDTHAPEEHNESRLNQLARPDVWEGLRNGLSEAYTAYMDRNGGGVDGSMIADVAREIEEVLRRNMKSVGIAVGPQTLEVGPPPHPPANGAPVPPVTRTVKVEVEPMFGVPTQVVRSAESTDDALRFWRTYWPESAPAHARSIADVLDDTAMPLRTFFEHLETYIGHACNRGAVNRVVDVRGDSHVRARDLVRLLGSFSSLKGAVEALEMRKDGFYEEEDDSLPPPYESAEHFHHPANVAGVPPAPEIGSKETAEQRSVYCEQRSDENERASSTPRQLPQSNGVPSFNAAELYALSEAQRNALEIQAQSLEKVQRAMEQMQRREHEHQAGMFGNATRTLEQMQRWEQGNQSSPYGQGFQGWSWGPGLQPMYGDGIGPMPPMPSVPPIPSVPDVSININYTEGRPPVVAMGRGGSVRPPMGRGGMSNPMGFLPRPPTFNVPMQLPFWSSAARPILPMNVPGQPVPNSPREGKFSPTRYWRNVKTYKEEEHPAYLSFWVQYFGSAVKTNWGKFFKKFCQESYDLNPFDEEYWFKRFCETEEQGPSSASVSMTSTSSGSSVGSSSLPIIHGRRSRHTAVTLTRFLAKLPKSIQLSVDDSMSPYVSSKADEGVAVTWADFIDEMVRQKAWTVDTMLDISSIRSYLVEGSWASDRIVYDNMGDVGSLADQAALLIANELKRNGTVKEVTIRPNNGLTDFGVIALAEALRVNFRVEKVDISGNTDLTKVAVRVIDRVLTRENLCVREVLFYDCELRFHASKVQCYNRVKWERRRGKGKRGRGRRDSRRHWHHDRHHFGDGSTSLKNKYSRSTIESDPSVDGSDGDSNSSGNNNTESNDEVSEIDYTSGGDMQAMMLRAREQEARINSKLAVIDSEMGQLGMQEESLKMGLHRVAGDAAQEEVMRVSLDGLREAKERMQFQHAVCESKLDQVRDNLQTLMVLIESTVGSTAASSSGVSGGGSGSTGPPTVERKWSAGEIERPVVVRRAEHALPPAVSKARTLPEEGLSNGIRRSASSDAPRVGRTSSADTERGGGGIWANLFKPKEDPSRTASTTPEPSSSTSTPPPSLPAKMISREALAAGGQTDTPLPLQWLGKALAFMNGQGGQTVVTVADAAPTSSSSATSTPTAATTTTTDTAAGHAKSDIEDTTASNAMRENEEDECERDVSEHYEAGREGLYPPSRTGGSVAT
ncbi:hypothetical protein BJ742DRAFT_843006 [Cladochytrium replicatum]|nr:hypothetical protein BJ742DRAFT_843006 [Cladochytrium replicatum]